VQQLIPNPSEGKVRALFGTGKCSTSLNQIRQTANQAKKMNPFYLQNADDMIPEHGVPGYMGVKMSSSVTGGSRDSPHDIYRPSPHDADGRLRQLDDYALNAFAYGPFKGFATRPGDGLEESSNAQNNIFERIREARFKAEEAKRRIAASPEAEEEGLVGDHGEPGQRLRGADMTQAPFAGSKHKTAASGTTTMAGRVTRGSLMQAPGSRAQQPDQTSDYSAYGADQRQSQGSRDPRVRYQSQIARN